jgi:diaminohydroxyphosphoribosylaminopyrimidine deaminase/5-amino-6-(5-phosphoribosylamino)uracil reductase
MIDPFDLKMMEEAIEQARQSTSANPNDPKVGAVICKGERKIAARFRTEEAHAEKHAIDSLSADPTQLTDSTLYTTLEPCTPEVRSDPDNCCTEYIKRHHIGLFII